MDFIPYKDEVFEAFAKLFKKITSERDCNALKIRSDYGIKFENQAFDKFCSENDMDHNFSASKTLQQNGIVE